MLKVITLAAISVLSITQANAITPCSTNKQINNFNHSIIFNNTVRGDVREQESMMTGTGDNGDQLSGQTKYQYNRCGELIDFASEYQSLGKNTELKMIFTAAKTTDGWQVKYDVSVLGTKEGKNEVVYQKIGSPRYYTDKTGKITHSEDNFIENGKQGVTKMDFYSDSQDRLISYTTRGDDKLMNGKHRYFYQPEGPLFSVIAPNTSASYVYDQQGRDLQFIGLAVNDYSLRSTRVDCQKWDSDGSCLYAVSSEIEIYPYSVVKRDSVIKTNINYWND